MPQRLKRLANLSEGFPLGPLHGSLRLAVWARDDGLIEGNLAQLLRLVFSADPESLPRRAHFEQRHQSMRAAHGVYPRSDRPNRLPKRLARGTLQRFAQLPAVCDLRAGRMQTLWRRLR